MNAPVLDPRSLQDIMAQVAALARQYTPEWRYEDAEDDPGAAIARLFGEMFYQTVDRFNSVPQKLYTEFLELAGVRMPDPLPASGLLQFTAHDAVKEPVPVPAGTQMFTSDEEGESIVYETERNIESTPARLEHLFYVDAREEIIQELSLTESQTFFAPGRGRNLQCHRFCLSQNEVLTLSGPCAIELEVQGENRFTAAETAKTLADPKRTAWSYREDGEQVAFSSVRVEGSRIILNKATGGALEPEEDGNRYLTCTATAKGGGSIILRGVRLRSRPEGRRGPDGLAFGDVPIDLTEGGYCFGRRPGAYALFYLRADQVLCKRGATVNLRLDIAPIVTDLADQTPQYSFTQRIIDKTDAVAIRPDDVFVDQVVWEYYNGLGWTRLEVTGNKNPFSCRETGRLETLFRVPPDLSGTEVNAEIGLYIRARVVHVEHEFSTAPRWVVPFVRQAEFFWSYEEGRPADRYRSENNGCVVKLDGAAKIDDIQFPAVVSLTEKPRAIYLCFDRSPHAMPLSLLFEVSGRAPLNDKLAFEAWTGARFEPVRAIDLTRNLLHTGLVLLYLPRPLPETRLFGIRGSWLRMIRSSYQENSGGYPRVAAVRLNTVSAVQRRRAGDQWFDAGVYEAGKVLRLLDTPVQNCRVWVDEISGLSVAESEDLAHRLPDRVHLEREEGVLAHCWVRWRRLEHLELADGRTRGYQLDPYKGTLTFGDGAHGRVPPAGENNIRVSYASGGGVRGNRPRGAVTELVGALPRISAAGNLTPMSGGTDRFSAEKLEALGNRRIRHRYRALGAGDFEEMVAEAFPQVLHVKCFTDRDKTGGDAPGHVTLVVENCDQEGGPAAADLCDRVWSYLEPRCNCTLTAAGLLHIIPSTVVTVNTEVTVEMEDLDAAADTQQAVADRLAQLINHLWRARDIGDQIRVDQIWQTIRDTPNVRLTRKVLVEGVYDQNGAVRSVPLEDDRMVPYATVRSGTHIIQIS